MATLATFFRRTDWIAAGEQTTARVQMNHYQLRALPNDDVYFYSKRIDNSRIIRQADPQAKTQCWSAIGAACLLAVLVGSVAVPSVGARLAGYKVETLKQERQALLDERKKLEVEEAAMLSPARLDALAKQHNLSGAAAGQVIHLDSSTDSTLAFNVKSPRE